MSVHVGTSGWSYSHWESVLYPAGLPRAERLGSYVQAFRTVELNASFYRWPREQTFAGWQRRLPPGFLLSVKAPRGLTHAKRLYAPEIWVERLVSCCRLLADKRGVLLVQLPPQFARDDPRLEYFLRLVPTWLRVAIEFRHPSWLDDQVFELLSRHGAAYVGMSGAGLPWVLKATAPFDYLRMHGPDHDHLYAGSYSDGDLGWWADRIREWQRLGHSVFVYFNNDGGGHAVRNAWTVRNLLDA